MNNAKKKRKTTEGEKVKISRKNISIQKWAQ